ncbi:NADP-dependent phosphogluconate dehydrogenase, partial [Candidatus Aerophobetes bacterium]|nr:NADP-dependent phosphogluconate dehydrogenase [Candidatus Aerophobetes bacterium]
GVIGLAVMGQNLVLNIESRGFSVSVYNRTSSKTKIFLEEKGKGKSIFPFYSLQEFVFSLKKPRKILLMVKAGEAVDSFLSELVLFLEEGDIVMDGGNSHFKDTERRYHRMKEKGIYYLGVGISGGEMGALHGPCIMPGGDKEAYLQVEDILTAISAKTEDGPCCTYLGPSSAGHFVKMVHNGIEYAVMQIIAESYSLMRNGLEMKIEDIKDVIHKWNLGELNSYLMEITVNILGKKDDFTGKPLVEVILDKAEQKGTGKWTSQTAFDLGVSVPTITAAVEARILSSLKDLRMSLSERLKGEERKEKAEKREFLGYLENACYASILLSYIQGMHLLSVASDEFGYSLNLSEIARIWKGGCIIRARILNLIKDIYAKYKGLSNLLVADEVGERLGGKIHGLRKIIIQAKKWGIPTPALSSSLNYYDTMRASFLPANLIQAQRDYFGAHTYQRIDKEGSFHTCWEM